jgi:hypothetical protein
MNLELAGQEVERRLNQIAQVFKPGVKLTLLARTPGNDEADFLMTTDQPEDIRAALDRRLGRASSGERISQAATDVLAERGRQIAEEGWTADHDDEHSNGSIAVAAACYATAEHMREIYGSDIDIHGWWPWAAQWWKPSPANPRRELVKAGALILAEIERLDRISKEQSLKCRDAQS